MPKNVRLKGDYSENSAVLYFQKRDFYVFKCCQNHGAVDIITIDSRNRSLKLWDVKTQSYRKDGTKISRLPRRKRVGHRIINIIYYDIDKEVCFIPKKRKRRKK